MKTLNRRKFIKQSSLFTVGAGSMFTLTGATPIHPVPAMTAKDPLALVLQSGNECLSFRAFATLGKVLVKTAGSTEYEAGSWKRGAGSGGRIFNVLCFL